MLLTVEVKENNFFGDRYYFLSLLEGFAWNNGKKFFGIVEEKGRFNVSANNKEEIIEYLLKIPSGNSERYRMNDLIEKYLRN